MFLVEFHSTSNTDAFMDTEVDINRLMRDENTGKYTEYELRYVYQFTVSDNKVRWATYEGKEIDATEVEFHSWDDLGRYTFNTFEG
jgi:hypothetical protein